MGDMSIRHAVLHDFLTDSEAVASVLTFAPESESLVCGMSDGRVLEWDLRSATLQREFRGHEGEVTSIMYSPDGQWIATSGVDGWIYVTSLTGDGQDLSLMSPGAVYDVEFSPQGTFLAAAGESRTVRLWDVATWEEQESLLGHTAAIHGLGISPAEDLLVTAAGGNDPTIRLWNLETGDEVCSDLYEGLVHDVEYSPRSRDRYASVAGTQNWIRLWEIDTCWMRHGVGTFNTPVRDIDYSSLGNTMVAVSEGGRFFFTTMPHWTEKRSIQFEQSLISVAFSPSRQYIAIGDELGNVFLLYVPQ